MNVTFVSYGNFLSNSAVHIFALANELTRLEIRCSVAVPRQPETVNRLGTPLFETVTYAQSLAAPPVHDEKSFVYAWTPREIVRQHTLRLVAHRQAPYVVHLEDNEDAVLTAYTGKTLAQLEGLSAEELDRRVGQHYAHPQRYREFLQGAAGVSTIIDRLGEFVPAGVPTVTAWPGYDEELFKPVPRNDALRRKHGIPDSDFLAVYTGTTHPANRHEVDALYEAVRLARERGIPARLVRTGHAAHRLRDRLVRRAPAYCRELGHVARQRLPGILAMADVLIQPGADDAFNAFRFPSKLTDFFAAGKPVILPNTNVGRFLRDEVDCLLLRKGTPAEMADKIERLFHDADLAKRLGENGRQFALDHFRWPKTAETIAAFLDTLPPQGKPGMQPRA